MTNQQDIDALIEKVLALPKEITEVVGGPFTQENKIYWRLAGNKIAEAAPSVIGDKKNKIRLGIQVVTIGSAIVGVLPDELQLEEKQPEFQKIKWEEIGGLKSQVAAIRDAVELPIVNSKIYKEYGIQPLKGLLLYGPPGCGKTLIAKAIASYILGDNGNFIYIKGGELLAPLVGVAENAIKQHFEKARAYQKKYKKRAVIFIDEAEAILPKRGSRISDSANETIVPTFLAEMDGLDENGPFIILSTNLPDSLDAAIIRPGRIDLKIEIGRPTMEDAIDIFTVHLNKTICKDSVSSIAAEGAQKLHSHAPNKMSGATIELVIKNAVQSAIKRTIINQKCEKGVTKEDILQAIKNI